jgi:hypothetical protein
MPESVTDRPTSSHEYLFLLTRSGEPTYWTHRERDGARIQPAPDHRWLHRETGAETAEEPLGWQTERMPSDRRKRRWTRVNLWRGHDYFYDEVAVREPWADDRQGRDGSKLASVRNRGGREDGYTKPNGIDPSANGGRNLRSVQLTALPQPRAGEVVDGGAAGGNASSVDGGRGGPARHG